MHWTLRKRGVASLQGRSQRRFTHPLRKGPRRMIETYTAVGLIPTFWGIRRRDDIQKNLEHIEDLTKAAFWLANLDIPVRLVAIPEGGLQGFSDEILDLDHAEFAKN